LRWKLLRRRLSISSPRMIVRSSLPWPLRWIALALLLGFSAALSLWAFEVGKGLAGLDTGAKVELERLRAEVEELSDERNRAQSIANAAESLLKAEKTSQEQLTQQLKQLQADNLALKADLGFFERLLPPSATGPDVRALDVQPVAPGQLQFQMLIMAAGKQTSESTVRYEFQLGGTLDGKPWTLIPSGVVKSLRLKQSARVEGIIDHPPQAVVKTVQVRLFDIGGAVRASRTINL
jgi:hypothetical protein